MKLNLFKNIAIIGLCLVFGTVQAIEENTRELQFNKIEIENDIKYGINLKIISNTLDLVNTNKDFIFNIEAGKRREEQLHSFSHLAGVFGELAKIDIKSTDKDLFFHLFNEFMNFKYPILQHVLIVTKDKEDFLGQFYVVVQIIDEILHIRILAEDPKDYDTIFPRSEFDSAIRDLKSEEL